MCSTLLLCVKQPLWNHTCKLCKQWTANLHITIHLHLIAACVHWRNRMSKLEGKCEHINIPVLDISTVLSDGICTLSSTDHAGAHLWRQSQLEEVWCSVPSNSWWALWPTNPSSSLSICWSSSMTFAQQSSCSIALIVWPQWGHCIDHSNTTAPSWRI